MALPGLDTSLTSNNISSGSATVNPANIVNSIGGVISTVSNILTAKDKTLSLPLANPLDAYATYDYIFTLTSISDADLKDNTFMKGYNKFPIIAKTASSDPNNRVQTAFGKHEFYIDNVTMTSSVGYTGGKNTNVHFFSFEVTEPYSIGLFVVAMQQAAFNQNHKNFKVAPYVLTVEFRGNKEDGGMEIVPNCTRHIPFTVTSVDIQATEAGSKYTVNCTSISTMALTVLKQTVPTDINISGKTVQEVLQSGPLSLQNIVNTTKKQNAIKDQVSDQILILFPTDISSSAVDANSSSNTATVNPTTSQLPNALISKFNLTVSTDNAQNILYSSSDVNAIGQASMGFNKERKADAPTADYKKVYDKTKQVNVRSSISADDGTSSFRFAQNIDIPSIINEVILNSTYAIDALSQDKIDAFGNRTWWRIDTQVFNIASANDTSTNTKPTLTVYRVVPYLVHTSTLMASNSQPIGLPNLAAQVPKVYQYIYTGKNTSVLKFDIKFNFAFTSVFQFDDFNRSQDSVTAKQTGDTSSSKQANGSASSSPDSEPSTNPGSWGGPARIRIGTDSSSDNKGGGGSENSQVRIARTFFDALNNPNDMLGLDLEIIGDPFWIIQSGVANYTAKPGPYINVNQDGTVNYQNGEVHIGVIFKSPLDINQSTGMYDFGKSSDKSSSVIGFNGLYRVINVESRFQNGMFTQVLKGNRLPNQENKNVAKPNQTLNTNPPPATI
jgi:hypothetical protein